MGRAGGCVIGPLCARGRGFSQESKVIRVFRCEATLYLSGVRRGQGIAVLEREAERGRAGLPGEGGRLRVRSRRWRGERGGAVFVKSASAGSPGKAPRSWSRGRRTSVWGCVSPRSCPFLVFIDRYLAVSESWRGVGCARVWCTPAPGRAASLSGLSCSRELLGSRLLGGSRSQRRLVRGRGTLPAGAEVGRQEQ